MGFSRGGLMWGAGGGQGEALFSQIIDKLDLRSLKTIIDIVSYYIESALLKTLKIFIIF